MRGWSRKKTIIFCDKQSLKTIIEMTGLSTAITHLSIAMTGTSTAIIAVTRCCFSSGPSALQSVADAVLVQEEVRRLCKKK